MASRADRGRNTRTPTPAPFDVAAPGPFPILNDSETVPEFKRFSHSIEQATFLEWQNSGFAAKGTKDFRSCQDCHMPGGFVSPDRSINLDQVVTQIATIEDSTYPMVDHGARAQDLFVPIRQDYKRHELVGLNVFVETMFEQFDPILGIDLVDPMTGPFDLAGGAAYDNRTNGNVLATANMVRQAHEGTVDIALEWARPPAPRPPVLQVTVTNKVGHRFPSGVGFRRAFLEVLIRRKSNRELLWSSGRTNGVGVIVDGQDRPLPTEFLPDKDTYQRHHQLISSDGQVQIYEELTLNAKGEFNTSFIHRDSHPKDNRLLARGWLSREHLSTRSAIVKQFLEATDPEGVGTDPDFDDKDGKGATGTDRTSYVPALPQGVGGDDVVATVSMYYQAIPPFYLRQRFQLASDKPATQRLYYIASRLATKGTPMEDWKLRVNSASLPAETEE